VKPVAAVPLASIGAKSNTTNDALPVPTNMKLPSAETSSPFGPDNGFRLLEREAQHCPPGNPPNRPFGPKKPGRRKPSVLHPKRV
jgi:hypothetical protein